MSKQQTETKSKLQEIIAQANKDYGAGTIIGGSTKSVKIDAISTGSWNLDRATGIGGIPIGRIIEFIGPESAGKTTVALHVIAEAQKAGGICAFVDAEHALDIGYASRLGVDMDRLVISQPDFGEQALEVAKRVASSGEVRVVVIDSVAALVPKSETEGEIGDANVGKQSRLMSQALRILTPIAEKNNCTILFINQIRMRIGGYGNPEVGAGGEALKFYASMRVDIRKYAEKDNQRSKTVCTVMKNKCASPFKKAEFYVDWGIGINRTNEIFDLAIEAGIINKSGSWYTLGDRKEQGEEKWINIINENPLIKEGLISNLKEKGF